MKEKRKTITPPEDIWGSKESNECFWGAVILRRVYERLDEEAEEIGAKFRCHYERRETVSEKSFRRGNILSLALRDIEGLYVSEFGFSRSGNVYKDLRTAILNITTDTGSANFLPFTQRREIP